MTKPVFPYPLPRGLSAGETVTILALDDDTCLVSDVLGIEWRVPIVALDPGCYVWHDGAWVPESEEEAAGDRWVTA